MVTQDQTLLRQELQDSVVHGINAGITPSVTNHGTVPNAPDPPLGGVGDHTGNLAPLPSYSSSNYMQSPCQASFVQATKAKHGKQMMEIVGQNPKNQHASSKVQDAPIVQETRFLEINGRKEKTLHLGVTGTEKLHTLNPRTQNNQDTIVLNQEHVTT